MELDRAPEREPGVQGRRLGRSRRHRRAGLGGIRYFAARPGDAVRYFKDRVRPVPDPKQVAVWIEQLGSDDFNGRENANKQLAGVAEGARGNSRRP